MIDVQNYRVTYISDNWSVQKLCNKEHFKAKKDEEFRSEIQEDIKKINISYDNINNKEFNATI